jgi:hypothetical protein
MMSVKNECPTIWRAFNLCCLLLLSASACSSTPATGGEQSSAEKSDGSAVTPTDAKPTSGGVGRLDAGSAMDSGGDDRPITSTSSVRGGAGGSASQSGAGGLGASEMSTVDGGVAGSGGAAGSAGKAGSTASGGVGGAGTSAGSGGAPMRGTRPDDEDAGVCVTPEQNVDLSNAKRCPVDICSTQDSVCLPVTSISLLVPQSTIDLLANCSEADKCVPVAIAQKAGKALLPTCRSINGVEGRCTSQCVPLVATQASLLPKDTCPEGELCAPCFDPRTGEDTLACRQGCDSGPTDPPKTFDKCCSDRGLCVPPELAASQAKNLNQDTCGTGTLCAPTELTDPMFKAKTCDSIDGTEGRCISTCVGGAVARQRDRLPTAGCGTDEICAPCYDPITGEDTGACTVNGDKPAKPKQTFARCCGESNGQPVGVCVSPELAGGQAMALRQEICGEGKLCAPIAKASDPAFEFQTCSSILGNGVCVNECIPDPTQAALLSRAGCAQDELCAPCNLLGSPTGACL